MSRVLKFIIRATALLLVTMVAIFVSPRDTAIRNQARVVELLSSAYLNLQPGPSQVNCILLANGAVLLSGRDKVFVGYVLKADIRQPRFTIGAVPVKRGVTGLFSYFRDERGVIRVDMDGGIADDRSRPTTMP